MFQNGLQTIRFAIRSLRKNPGVTLAAIVTLTLGIGATTAVFSIVNSVLLRPLPFKDPDELVWIWSRRPDNNKAPFSLPDFLDHRDQNQTLEQIAAFGNIGLSLSGVERTDRLQALRVSANLFQLLGLRAARGRLMSIQDDEPARRYVVVLTYECWQRRFGSDSNIVGKSLILNGESYEVIGILPQNVSLLNPQAELAIPLAPDVDPLRTERGSLNFLRIIGRLKKGVALRQAEADLTGIVAREREEYGDAYRKKTGINVVPLYEELVGASRTSLWILLGAVSLVLIIGCCNLAALLLTRLTARSREMAIKKALGASSGRLAWQLVIESLILSLIGGAGGLVLATAGVRALSFFGSDQLPRNQEMSIDLRVLTFGIAASVLCALLFGTLPALQGAMVEANSALKSTTRGSGGAARLNAWRSLLVIGEVALSFVLLIGAGLLIQSFIRVQSVALGFDPANTLALRLSLPKTTYETRSSVALFNEKLFTNIKALAGVEDVGAVSILPMSGGGNIIEFNVVGQAISTNDAHSANYRVATSDYFGAMKISLVKGRLLSDKDREDTIPVALINESMARKLWPNEDAIGKELKVDDNNSGPRPLEIVGIVGDVRQINLDTDPTFDIYISMNQVHADNVGSLTNSYYCVVRSHLDSRAIETAVLSELQKIDRDAASSKIKPLESYVSDSIAPRRFSLRLLTIFSVVSLLLALTGIYGVVSDTVSQRTPEIGIRLALGARPNQVFSLVLGHAVRVMVAGLLLGLLGAFAITRLIRSLLFSVTPGDPLTFVVVSSALFVVTLLASCIPAVRALRVDPVIALKNE